MFEAAGKGTIFLDEFGEMSSSMQVRLLRVLQEHKVRPVGSEESKEINYNARVVVATNRDLKREVAEGRFRQDLYYRVNVFPIRSPALRDQLDDLPLLIDVLLNRLIDSTKLVRPLSFDSEALALLQHYSWPGNVRELENLMERLAINPPGTGLVSGADISFALELNGSGESDESREIILLKGLNCLRTSRATTVRRMHKRQELDFYLTELAHVGGNLTKAARRLGINRSTLHMRILDEVYLPWSKAKKKSWRDDVYMLPMLKEYFQGKTLREISAQLVEEFKNNRLNTPTKKNTPRRPATVNRKLTLLSSAYSLAVKYDKAESNPCSKVDLFTLDNLRYRYLMPDEEPRLMAALTGPRAHLQPTVTVALGTGMRMSEQLQMKRHQVDFLRNIVTARHTKNGRPRDIPMNDDVRQALADRCKDKRPDDYVFVSEKTGSCIREVKKGFHPACRIAGIEGLIWKDLRATFGTRLAEAGCDAFTIAQLLGHSDVRVTMRYVRAVETSKRVAVEAVRLNSGKVGHVLASWPKQPATALAVNH